MQSSDNLAREEFERLKSAARHALIADHTRWAASLGVPIDDFDSALQAVGGATHKLEKYLCLNHRAEWQLITPKSLCSDLNRERFNQTFSQLVAEWLELLVVERTMRHRIAWSEEHDDFSSRQKLTKVRDRKRVVLKMVRILRKF